MDAITVEARPALRATVAVTFDVDQMTEQVWRELGGQVSRETIQRVVSDVVPRYQDARIATYVPIFVRQDVLRELTGRK